MMKARLLGVCVVVCALVFGFAGVAAATPTRPAAYAGECKSRYLADSDRIEVPSTTSYSLNCWMDLGSTGRGVLALQLALYYCYGHHIDLDGRFGTGTRSALAAAQRTEHIGADGEYGTQTRTHLKFSKTNEVTDKTTCGHRL